jgi:type II restriction/modification system DNA methylase subunit YeeA
VQNLPPTLLRHQLRELADYRSQFLSGDEKGEAQIFCDRFFRALGYEGLREAGATLEFRIAKDSNKGTSFADLMWKPRCLIEMKKGGTDLSKHYRQAFDYWIRAVPDRPQYVVLCNFDEFWIYDFDQQLDAPVDRIQIDDLPDRWDALSFMLPEPKAPIFAHNLVGVTREAAADVAHVFTALVDAGTDRRQAQRFTLQCVMSMFAEDIGLLPGAYFTRAVEDCLENNHDPYDAVLGLFREMNTPGTTAAGRFAGTPYFNGGLFAEVPSVNIRRQDLLALRDAAKTNWSFVRPEIFGTLFEQSMDKGERHATGAHFTSQADIMRVVGPCIVDPWRQRIAEANPAIAVAI